MFCSFLILCKSNRYIVSIIASGSTNCVQTRGSNIDENYQILDLYDKDYNKLNKFDSSNPYPTADTLRKISIQGVNGSNPSCRGIYKYYSCITKNY